MGRELLYIHQSPWIVGYRKVVRQINYYRSRYHYPKRSRDYVRKFKIQKLKILTEESNDDS